MTIRSMSALIFGAALALGTAACEREGAYQDEYAYNEGIASEPIEREGYAYQPGVAAEPGLQTGEQQVTPEMNQQEIRQMRQQMDEMQRQMQQGQQAGPQQQQQITRVEATELGTNATSLMNRTVNVNAQVAETFGNYGFTLGAPGEGVTNDTLVIVPPNTVPGANVIGNQIANRTANVTGTVRSFNAAELERQFGVDFSPQVEQRFNAQPVLIAEAIGFE